ncbi:flagellar export protein FliJ [Candidatus Methylomirabilis sp.]|uniref:flagellar export protein FliJ n=1 Tax=Candidatus Methylomirabilis sp. TaxID=2032687 RepID=UPI002A5C30F4|nr:flagellar export protein FliJ [Candidatus Methylomirabilis sp.]
MKRFRFSLQSVLAVREAKVDQAEAELAERQRSCRALRERLAKLREAEAEALAELAVGQSNAQSGLSTLPVRRAYLLGIGERIKALEATLVTETAEAVRLRQVLLERSKEEQAIAHLKKRKMKAFHGEIAREQQAEIDEAAGGRWATHSVRGSVS